ncbi:Protein of unknown function [Gryllus bimaculatus]|nr:Protein of unknown function [Gryllus bimaculatus]
MYRRLTSRKFSSTRYHPPTGHRLNGTCSNLPTGLPACGVERDGAGRGGMRRDEAGCGRGLGRVRRDERDEARKAGRGLRCAPHRAIAWREVGGGREERHAAVKPSREALAQVGGARSCAGAAFRAGWARGQRRPVTTGYWEREPTNRRVVLPRISRSGEEELRHGYTPAKRRKTALPRLFESSKRKQLGNFELSQGGRRRDVTRANWSPFAATGLDLTRHGLQLSIKTGDKAGGCREATAVSCRPRQVDGQQTWDRALGENAEERETAWAGRHFVRTREREDEGTGRRGDGKTRGREDEGTGRPGAGSLRTRRRDHGKAGGREGASFGWREVGMTRGRQGERTARREDGEARGRRGERTARREDGEARGRQNQQSERTKGKIMARQENESERMGRKERGRTSEWKDEVRTLSRLAAGPRRTSRSALSTGAPPPRSLDHASCAPRGPPLPARPSPLRPNLFRMRAPARPARRW